MYVCNLCVRVYVYIYMYMCIYVCIYIYDIYVYMCIYLYIHTYIYIYIFFDELLFTRGYFLSAFLANSVFITLFVNVEPKKVFEQTEI